MNIFINGKELSVMLENETNAYEVLKPIEEWCNSNDFLINKVIIDNTELQPYIDEEYETIPVENIQKIEVEALSQAEYSLYSIMSIVEYIEKVSNTVSVNSKDIEDLKDGMYWVLDSIPRTIFLFNMSLESYGIIHLLKMLEVKLEKFNNASDNIDKFNEFFNNELKPFLSEKMLPAMYLVIEEAKINTIFLFAGNITSSNALYKVGSLPKFLPLILDILDSIVNKLQSGNDKEAFMYAEKFSRIVSYAFSILSNVASIYSIDYSQISLNAVTLTDAINDFNEMMNNVLDAFANEDYISIADLLEYEIKERIENIMNYIPLVEEHIEKLNV
ncbi:hypothetical protein [Brachyspira hyodysenteriae]|uniref:Uncharacterized protein n=1 Tax=Brachyspira hyodysenteriae (strain ATCC 49526 / WA1) TaxID=565034 RepID=A0A3B6VJH0_BRAHW|nr:hypothetical protein [Brachyspira hyodysenteriae]ACN84096.1 hypothetical protein BHWA1_01626 [Brachyspira hyodysenteriae WA1]AUJ49825.1 hypothetical protein BH718_01384 [Brachyspira hyodysenteriae]KLI22138.1 hypothetical protein SU46_00015 [Brachyspira hyodysenteriae]KLI29568.1 hypothetical protein SZ49_09595 [Brachyspira hyodysenteriae]KLI39140.1 hypothetical protein SZ51_05025 [Brachyspira hyodysenteriae]